MIVALDGSERELSPQMLVIADAKTPVAIAGVMGGANAEVTEQTTDVLIESAYFDPVSIRKTSKALGLSTEASYRFERGADPEMVITALDRAAALMAELAGGKVARGRIDEYPRKINAGEIRLRHERIKRILGVDVPAQKVVSILASLSFEILSEKTDAVRVRVPSHRPDVTAEIDLIEEVARIHGYENIMATYPLDTTVMTRGVQAAPTEEICRSILRSCGYSEVINLSFGSPSQMDDFPQGRGNSVIRPIRMKNPLAEDASALRTTLIPGLLHSLGTNINAGNKNLKIFETGKVYWPAEEKVLPDEHTFVCAAATGLSLPPNWTGSAAGVDFFDVKGVAETLLESLGCAGAEVKKASHEGFHPGVCADIVVDGKAVGKIGRIHPGLLEKYEVSQKVFLFELDLEVFGAKPAAENRYEKFSRFPSSDRDLAVVVDESVEASALSATIAGAGGEILKDILLFDIYRGEQVGEDKKSLAFSLRFQSGERTLTDDEVTAATSRIVKALEDRFDARLRA